jgi:hypothetical protein
MIELTAGIADPVAARPVTKVEQPIDVKHLARMTLGDSSLEREVLQLFDRQAEILFARMQKAAPAAAAAHAHTLKGSSSGIGAWKVARAAAAVEFAVASKGADIGAAIDRLGAVVAEVRAVIAERLRAN